MEVCPKCKSKLTLDEKSLGVCFSCEATFEPLLQNDKNSSFKNNTRNNLCRFLIGLFVITAIFCLLIYLSSNNEYTIAKGDVAIKKVNALQSNIWNLNPDVDTSQLNKIELKRNICVGGIITSVIGTVICCIVLYSKSNKTEATIKSQHTNNSTQSKLQELEQIYKNNLITQEEYENKKKEILDKL